MKKKMIFGLVLICIAVMCYMKFGGNTREVSRRVGYSEKFGEEDINVAMDQVEKKFKQKFNGCVLTDLWYDEFINDRMAEEWKEQYEADEAIILLSNYKVGKSGGDGSLVPGETYSNWQWILVREGDGTWKVKTWGYG